MNIKSLENLPNEIIIENVLVHLSSKDVLSFGMAGNDRFKELTEKVIKKKKKIRRHEKGSHNGIFQLRCSFYTRDY